MKAAPIATLFCILFFAYLTPIKAQEEGSTVYFGKKYLDSNLNSLEKLSKQVERQQTRLLKKLRRQEYKYARRLQEKDSIVFVRYKQQPLTFDSISKLSQPDSVAVYTKTSKRSDKRIDTLKAIEKFIRVKANGLNTYDLSGYSAKFEQANAQLSYQQYINELIAQHTKSLKSISNSTTGIVDFIGIEKNVFYASERIKTFKDICDEPSKLEERALEYLQGQEGFDQSLSSVSGSRSSLLMGKSLWELEKMGYQTKQQVTAAIQNRLGNSLTTVQEQMSTSVQQWQDKLNQVNKISSDVRNTKQAIQSKIKIDKPSFRINEMRGKPFWQRIEKQFNWQTSKATNNGQPAILQLSGMAGFKQTSRFSYGIGLSTAIGLGQNWNNIHFSFEGLGIRSYTSWQWQYGFGAYAGYERTFKFPNMEGIKEVSVFSSPHNTRTHSEAIVLGLTKSYRISEKWKGAVQVLYDVWWREKSLRSPIQLRFVTMTQ